VRRANTAEKLQAPLQLAGRHAAARPLKRLGRRILTGLVVDLEQRSRYFCRKKLEGCGGLELRRSITGKERYTVYG